MADGCGYAPAGWRPYACASPRSNSVMASLNRRASVSGSLGKPARIHSASRARSVWPTRGPMATPRAIRSAPLNGSLGSGVSARNRSAAANAASGRGAPDWVSASASASRAASRPALNSSARSAWNGGAAVSHAGRPAPRGGPHPVGLAVGETQPIAKPMGVLRDRDAERGEPEESVAATPRSASIAIRRSSCPGSRRRRGSARETRTRPSSGSTSPACGATRSFISRHEPARATDGRGPRGRAPQRTDPRGRARPRRSGRRSGRTGECADPHGSADRRRR